MFPSETELLIAIPEHKVPLPGGRKDSQSDVFALIRHGNLTCAAMIEGKVREPFGPTVGEWMAEASPGKILRMAHLCDILGLNETPASSIRYQLLHRTASAIIESRRFKTDEAAMIVHSFAQDKAWFSDFAGFAAILGANVVPDEAVELGLKSGTRLRLGWATGDASFLEI